MNNHYLTSLFTPQSVALFGASDRVDSVGGAFDLLPLFVVADSFPTGNAPPGALPGIAISSPGIVVVNGLGVVWNGLLPGGTNYSLLVPPGLAGFSVRFQAVIITTLAANATFASTDAHEIRVQ